MHKNVIVLALIKNTSVNTIQPEPGRKKIGKIISQQASKKYL